MLRKLVCILACSLGLATAAQAKGMQKETVGVVNFAKVVTESKMGKEEQGSFETMKNQMTASLGELEKQIQEISEKFKDEEYMESLNSKAEEELRAKFQKLNQEFAGSQNQFYQLLNQANMRIIQNIQGKIMEASEKVAKDKNLDMVLNKEVLFYYTPTLDVTSLVIAEMDAAFEKAQKEKPESKDTSDTSKEIPAEESAKKSK